MFVLGVVMACDTNAFPSFWNSRCASCHSDDTISCNGCHWHRNPLTATADQDAYAPGSTVTVTLAGGSQSGWIRGLLYDEANNELDRASGPTGTGDDGQGSPVTFPVSLQARAPYAPGPYTWEAAWFGSVNAGGGNHLESRVPVAIMVSDDSVAVPEEDQSRASTWSRIRALYR